MVAVTGISDKVVLGDGAVEIAALEMPFLKRPGQLPLKDPHGQKCNSLESWSSQVELTILVIEQNAGRELKVYIQHDIRL